MNTGDKSMLYIFNKSRIYAQFQEVSGPDHATERDIYVLSPG
jgi:hypothetical protein